MSCAEMAELIDLDLGGPKEAQVQWYSPGGTNEHNFSRIRRVVPVCPHGRTHWHHLANKTELFVCSGDAVLCQITLTTCYLWPRPLRQSHRQPSTLRRILYYGHSTQYIHLV